MNRVKSVKAILDGLLRSVMVEQLGGFLVSTYALGIPPKQCVVLGALCAIVATIVSLILMPKYCKSKVMLSFFVLSTLAFAASVILLFSFNLMCPLSIWPLRELNNADGVLLIFAIGSFLLLSFFLRASILLALVIKNLYKSAHQEK